MIEWFQECFSEILQINRRSCPVFALINYTDLFDNYQFLDFMMELVFFCELICLPIIVKLPGAYIVDRGGGGHWPCG